MLHTLQKIYKIYITSESVVAVRLSPPRNMGASDSGVMCFIERVHTMFTNTKFTKKHAPLFMDEYRFDGEMLISYSFLKPYILNDDSIPKKTLIALDVFQVPKEDLRTRKYKT